MRISSFEAAGGKRAGERAGVRRDVGLDAPLEYRTVPAREIPDGGGVLVVAAGMEVGVFRVHGELHAYENRCAHQGGPVCTGEIVGRYEQVLEAGGTGREERLG